MTHLPMMPRQISSVPQTAASRRITSRLRACLAALALLTTAAAGPSAPENPADFAWKMNPGAQVPLGVTLRDEAGREVKLADVISSQPVILDLGYFHCPALCGITRADLFKALETSGLKGGKDYDLVSISIDPAETPQDAAAAKKADLEQAPFATGAGWHYLTGTAPSIAAVTSAVGFRARYDPEYKQFLHPAGLVILTPSGAVSRYLQGIGYSGGDLRAAVSQADTGAIAQAASPILLLCFHYDAATGRYTLAIEKVLQVMGVVTILTIGGLFIVLQRSRPRH